MLLASPVTSTTSQSFDSRYQLDDKMSHRSNNMEMQRFVDIPLLNRDNNRDEDHGGAKLMISSSSSAKGAGRRGNHEYHNSRRVPLLPFSPSSLVQPLFPSLFKCCLRAKAKRLSFICKSCKNNEQEITRRRAHFSTQKSQYHRHFLLRCLLNQAPLRKEDSTLFFYQILHISFIFVFFLTFFTFFVIIIIIHLSFSYYHNDRIIPSELNLIHTWEQKQKEHYHHLQTHSHNHKKIKSQSMRMYL